MLDFELVKIYGYTMKRFNQKVKNNLEIFPKKYRFRRTKVELSNFVRSKILTAQNWTVGNGIQSIKEIKTRINI